MGSMIRKTIWAIVIALAVITLAYAATEFVSTVIPSGGTEGIKSGFGLEVEPPEIMLKDCPLGKKVAVSDLGGEKMKLRILNKGAAAYTYTINILFACEAGDSLKEGYRDIPDKSWLIPQEREMYIPANSAKEVELYLTMPKRKAYYDKKYQAIIEVKSKKNRPEDMFVLAVQLRICFSTIRELPLILNDANLRK